MSTDDVANNSRELKRSIISVRQAFEQIQSDHATVQEKLIDVAARLAGGSVGQISKRAQIHWHDRFSSLSLRGTRKGLCQWLD
jgi:hypothetical protein